MQEGLYRSEFEHDSCGIGAVVDLSNIPTHETISDALYMLSNMEHRGGRGSDPKTGDGAGILIQIPHRFLKKAAAEHDMALPEEGSYGVGMVFLPHVREVHVPNLILPVERHQKPTIANGNISGHKSTVLKRTIPTSTVSANRT